MENDRRKVLAISGSTRTNSTNSSLLKWIIKLSSHQFDIELFENIAHLPHFNPDLDGENLPDIIAELRHKIRQADGVIICTPEYVFSLPGALKNVLEWTVSTTIFSNKPVALIIASGSGEKASEQLSLIMNTLGARFNHNTQLLIKAARGKVTEETIDSMTLELLESLVDAFASNVFTTLNKENC